MKEAALVVLSRFKDVFEQVSESAARYEPDTRKILVRNNEDLEEGEWVPSLDGWLTLNGRIPFRFSQNANDGIRAASDLDVLLANDDIEFLELDTVAKLSQIAHSDKRIGILTPQIAGACKQPKAKAGVFIRPNPLFVGMVPFVCIYLKRSTLEKVGLLDEDFKCSFEDDDYCMRVKQAGLEVAITSDLTIRHGFRGGSGSETINRAMGGYRNIIPENREIFRRKWSGK